MMMSPDLRRLALANGMLREAPPPREPKPDDAASPQDKIAKPQQPN